MTKPKAKGAVAAGHQVTAAAAVEMLRIGGNAFDATLAALFASCVCEPVLSSLGGGGFLMAHQSDQPKTTLVDFFVQTPQQKQDSNEIEFKPIHADFGTTQQEFLIGMGASATPGFVSGCYEIHANLCSLPLIDILQPAIDAARKGVIMDGFQSRLFRIVEPILLNTDHTRAIFAPQGTLLERGDVFKNPQFAETLKTLGQEGPDFFYRGDVCQTISDLADNLGGHLTAEDFTSYTTIVREPLVQPFGQGDEIFLNPSPSAGGCLIGFGLALAQRLEEQGTMPESVSVANILRAIDHTRQAIFEDPELASCDETIARSIADLQHQTITSKGTTHISVIDSFGNAAATTVSNGEGNGHMVGDFGFMLNNMLGEEDLNPGGFHQWPCGVRLASMMAPTLVRNTQGALSVLGSGGANRIRSAMVQVLLHIKAGKTPEQAVNAARMHYEAGKVDIEDWMDQTSLRAVLSAYPQACLWDQPNMFFGGVHMVQRDKDGWFDGAGDKRRDGCFSIVD
jgi:gamma-glutamyltranspeptidase / glutathione hydrolase